MANEMEAEGDAESNRTEVEDILEEARKAFERAAEAEDHNRVEAEKDIRFARLGEQWPEQIRLEREREGRPCLVIPVLSPVIRQVVNDCRQNKPQIKVGPVDSSADIETADIYSDLIRNIETTSDAEVAYDTAVECAATSGLGYWRIGLDFAHKDVFELDISIERVLDPFSIYGDPDSIAADSQDWNVAFVVEKVPRWKFERDFGDAGKVDWDALGYTTLKDTWFDTDSVLVAEYWTREEYEKPICLLSDGAVISKENLEAATEGVPYQEFLQTIGVTVVRERTARCWKVKQRRLTGAEILSERDWPGQYIPIVPVYGEEVFSEGKRHLLSLTRHAQDAQRNYNYWRSAATELAALAPRVPYIGPEEAFAGDVNWSRANKASLPYLKYRGNVPPQRQPLDVGPAAGALQEALNASDDIKRITGMYDASLGARSNETSGKAIMARQREGDVSTFHFTDNLNRAIRHTGRILIDLIPHVYSQRRIIRVRGEDGESRQIPLQQPVPQMGPDGKPMMKPQMGPDGQPVMQPQMGPDGMPMMQPGPNGPMPVMQPKMIPVTRVYDLTAGKYDLVVKAGPSFTTRREEAATQLTEALRSIPQAAPVLVPRIFKNLDLPEADDIGRDLEALAPKPNPNQIPEPVQKQMQQAQKAFGEMQQQLQRMQQENQALQMQLAQAKTSGQADAMKAQSDMQRSQIEMQKLRIDAFNAETDRFKALSDTRLNWAEMGIQAQMDAQDMAMAHAQTQQHGLEGGQPPPPMNGGVA